MDSGISGNMMPDTYSRSDFSSGGTINMINPKENINPEPSQKTQPSVPPAGVNRLSPASTDVHCYGKSSEKYADQLLNFIDAEYRDYIYYRILSQKAPSDCAGQIFYRISRDERNHSRKFAAAYFLITGNRYIPKRSSAEQKVVLSSYEQALRDRYITEYSDFEKYDMFTKQTDDAYLKALAERAAEDEHQHAELILAVIENLSCRY